MLLGNLTSDTLKSCGCAAARPISSLDVDSKLGVAKFVEDSGKRLAIHPEHGLDWEDKVRDERRPLQSRKRR